MVVLRIACAAGLLKSVSQISPLVKLCFMDGINIAPDNTDKQSAVYFSVKAQMAEPQLLERVGSVAQVKHMSRRTAKVYVYWIKRFILFHHKRHPSELGAEEIAAFLSHLAVNKGIAASTQNQALNALAFL